MFGPNTGMDHNTVEMYCIYLIYNIMLQLWCINPKEKKNSGWCSKTGDWSAINSMDFSINSLLVLFWFTINMQRIDTGVYGFFILFIWTGFS